MTKIIFVITNSAADGYVAKALGASIVTQADDFPSLREAACDAVRAHFDDPDKPRVIRLHHVHEEVFVV